MERRALGSGRRAQGAELRAQGIVTELRFNYVPIVNP